MAPSLQARMTTMLAAPILRRLLPLPVIAAAALPLRAEAYWRGGVWVGGAIPVYPPPPVIVAPPPVYYPPPTYYPPPVYAPPTYSPPAYGGPPPPGAACYAGPYVCRLDRPTPVGNACACDAGGSQVWGRAR
jgi:hypothetical protein